MRFGDILRLCRQNLWRRKSRTILTVLGVIVGCCSIVLMVSLGQGINEQMNALIKSMGDLSIVTVYADGGPDRAERGGSSTGSGAKLDDKALESFRAMNGVDGVTPMMDFPYTVTARAGAGGRYLHDYVQVMGVDMTQFDRMGYKLVGGEKPFRDDQVLAGETFAYGFLDTLRNGERRMGAGDGMTPPCVSGADAQCEGRRDEKPFFDPLVTRIRVTTGVNYQGDQYTMSMQGGGSAGAVGAGGGVAAGAGGGAAGRSENITLDLQISGVTASDYGKGFATSDGLIMDVKAMKALAAKVNPSARKSDTYSQVLVKAADLGSVPEVESQIKALGYETSSYEDMRRSMDEQSRAVQLILGGIGAVALLVAAIGIANTMIMSVTERTREIGIMKALGCYVRDIRIMFLAEAGAIGFFGGLIGCALSGLVSLGINVAGMLYASGAPGAPGGGDGAQSGASLWTILRQAVVGGEQVTRYSVIPWWLFLFAVLFSTLIGVLFGFGPANKAVRIPALDAIKNSE